MFKRHFSFAVFLSLSWFAHAANAGEITLYSHDNMRGQEVTLREPLNDFSAIGFNDRASSLVVSSGRWELCEHADFRGQCQIVEPGQYPTLASFGNTISSAREVRGRRDGWRDDDRRRDGWRDDDRRGDDRRADGAPVTLFDGTDMRGRQLPLNGNVQTLVDLGFNDATQSIVIEEGNWEFCVHRDFEGPCRILGPGQYRNLERVFHRSISSVRQVRSITGRRDPSRGEGLALFSRPGFSGERLQVQDEVRTLVDFGFNDRAGSVIVFRGQWELCQHADFRGQCVVFGPGRYDELGNLNNQISSIRRVR